MIPFVSGLKYGVETRVLQIDFRDDELIYKNIADKLKGLDIGVLINNVGTMGSLPEYYHNTPDLSEVIRNITRVNITSTLKVRLDTFVAFILATVCRFKLLNLQRLFLYGFYVQLLFSGRYFLYLMLI